MSELVDDYRLTTLVGPGGFGKTRLAVEVARALLDKMPDGAWLVELASVASGTDVPAAVLAAMDLREPSLAGREKTEDPLDRLVGALRSRSVLVVLDNCEHVIDGAAALADRLLAECPRLRIVATSREPLGITGEAVWPVDPLGLPPEDLDGRAVIGYDAVRLLVERARAVRPGFTVTDDNTADVALICRVLDGMPLAIELAAARIRTMTVAQLAERLDDRFRLLTGGSRTAVPRHQTLRAAIDWSWDLLSDAERFLLRRLAIFTGGATQEAVQRVCADAASQQITYPTWSPRSSTSRCWWFPGTRCRATRCSRPSRRTAWTGSTRQENAKPSAARTPRTSSNSPRPPSHTCAAPSSWSGFTVWVPRTISQPVSCDVGAEGTGCHRDLALSRGRLRYPDRTMDVVVNWLGMADDPCRRSNPSARSCTPAGRRRP